MISSIRLQNFRSYGDQSFEFDPGVNIIVGPNASGKTNLLEAVMVLGRGSSYRARDSELIKINKPWVRLEGFFDGQSRILKLKKEDEVINKVVEMTGKSHKRLSYNLKVPIVFFEPGDLQLISRGPQQRREFVDGLLEKSLPEYKTILNQYNRSLAQRNSLLKRGSGFGQTQLFAWNLRLSELGERIALSRYGLIRSVNRQISSSYSNVAQHRSKVVLEYASQFPVDSYASKMLKKLESATTHDYARGFTAYGPHREDINLYLNRRLVNQTASRGEVRSLVLALKFFELELVEEVRGQKPLLLLDDVFSELDGARRHSLVEYIKDYQTIITTTDADSVIAYFSTQHTLISTQ